MGFTVLDEVAVARRPPSLRFLFHLSPLSDSLTFNLVSLQLDLNHSGYRKFHASHSENQPHEKRFHVVLLFYL